MKLTRLNELIEDGQTVKGTWELLPGHVLGYRGKGKDEEYRLKAAILAAEPDAIVAAATIRQDDQTVVTGIIKVTGRWKTDGKDRIVFDVERAAGKSDRLTLTGTWSLNDDHDIVYRYRSAPRERVHQLTFKGAWDLGQKNQITYLLEGDSGSEFRFRGAFQTPSILAKKGEIRFVIGAEASGRTRPKPRAGSTGVRTVTFFGSWKFSRDFALTFALDAGPGRRKRVLKFGADWTYQKGRSLAAELRSESGRPLGAELVWTRSFAVSRGDGEVFARLARSVSETSGEAGVRVRW